MAATVEAAPTISITAPPAGPIYDLRPTITIAYSSDGAPLDAASLRVVVNGVDWTEKFAKGPSSATYAVTAADELIGGSLRIEALIADQAVPPETAQATQDYQVFPTFQAVSPLAAYEGELISLAVAGLDPDPASDAARFPSMFRRLPDMEEATFASADRANHSGTVRVPPGAISGRIRVSVNGNASREQLRFNVLREFTSCTWPVATKLFSMADGSLLSYTYYYAGGGAGCPPAPSPHVEGIALRQEPGSPVTILRYEPSTAENNHRRVQGLAVDKTGTGLAFLIVENVPGDSSQLLLKVETHQVATPLAPGPFLLPNGTVSADFARDGSLYLAIGRPANVGGGVGLYRIPSDSAGTIESVANFADLVPFHSFGLRRLAVSCDGHAYIAFDRLFQWPRMEGVVRRLDLATRATADIPISNGILLDIALTGNDGEVLGTKETDPNEVDIEVWRSLGASAPGGVDFFPNAYADTGLTVGPTGAVYIQHETAGIARSRYQVGVPAQPYCAPTPPGGLVILPSTTRWKPQRSDDPIVVDFEGPNDLDLTNGTLEIARPAGTITFTGPITATSTTAPFTYRMEWTGPWTYTDPADGQVKRLPPANYPIVVVGTTGTAPNQRTLRSALYDKVSLVEVKGLEVAQCGSIPGVTCSDGGALVDSNTGAGGGKAAFPDAILPGVGYRRALLVKAELEPNLGPDAGQVTVHFRAIDVDDPSAQAAGSLIDDDTVATSSVDNRNETAVVNPSVAASPALGGAAVTEFSLSTRQGNNYRLAASTHASWLPGIEGVTSSDRGLVTHTTGEQILDAQGLAGRQVSQMLTVWRTLHLELDRIQPGGVTQAQLQVDGTWTSIRKKKLKDGAANFIDTDHPQRDDWEGADLNPYAPAGQDFLVDGNDATEANIKSGDLRQIAQPSDPRYYLRDDVLSSLTGTGHDVALLTPLVESAYIKIEPHLADSANPNPDLPWDRVLTSTEQSALPRDTASSPAYWAVPLVLAFEGLQPRNTLQRATHDPTPPKSGSTSGLLGLTTQGDQPISASFSETIRDFATTNTSYLKPTVPLSEIYVSNQAHEVLHALTLWHNGGIMCSTRKNYAADPARYQLTELQRARLRFEVDRPGGFFRDDWVCGMGGRMEPDCCPERPLR